MLDAIFKLEPDAKLVIAGFSFPAFSGLGESRNRRTHMCLPLLHRLLEATTMERIPGTKWMSYGTVVVS